MEIRYFGELTPAQKNMICADCMAADSDDTLSFALIDNQAVIGYALLRENLIPDSMAAYLPVGLNSSRNAREIIRDKSLNPQKGSGTVRELLRHAGARIEMWTDKENGPFDCFWGTFEHEADAVLCETATGCERAQYPDSENNIRHIVYKLLPDDFTD